MSKILSSLLLAMIWLTGVLHVELESAGLLPQHTHVADFFHSAQHDEGSRGHADHSHGLAAHDELVARNGLGWLGLFVAVALVTAIAFGVRGLLRLIRRASRSPGGSLKRLDGLSRTWSFGVRGWSFLRRCAADSLAPPVAA